VSSIAIDLNEGLAAFIVRGKSELLARKHNGDIWLTYEDALHIHSTLGRLLKRYEEIFGTATQGAWHFERNKEPQII
jgi:hypothetical protein